MNNEHHLQEYTTEHQAVTGGIFYCRDSGNFSVSSFNKLSCKLVGYCFEIGNKNIPPTVTANAKKDNDSEQNERQT
jgi:hypothetical protein